jgi:hypothetical protein
MTEYTMMRMVEPKINAVAQPQTCASRTDSPEPMTATVQASKAEAASQEKYAPKSDVPFQSVARLLIGGFHFAVLAGIVALLVSHGIAAMRVSKQMAVVKVFAPDMHTVFAPASGQFQAARPFSMGEWVPAGEVLGKIETREIRDQLRSAKRRLSSLQREMLLATQAARTSASTSSEAHDQHIGRLRLEANTVQSEIERLGELEEELYVRSPIDGRIWFGLSGSKEVSRHEDITPIWPSGSDLRIEIEAPQKYIDEILLEGTVECRFATPNGERVVTATPIPTTHQMVLSENEENRSDKQVLGRIECIPQKDSSHQLLPGWIGTL